MPEKRNETTMWVLDGITLPQEQTKKATVTQSKPIEPKMPAFPTAPDFSDLKITHPEVIDERMRKYDENLKKWESEIESYWAKQRVYWENLQQQTEREMKDNFIESEYVDEKGFTVRELKSKDGKSIIRMRYKSSGNALTTKTEIVSDNKKIFDFDSDRDCECDVKQPYTHFKEVRIKGNGNFLWTFLKRVIILALIVAIIIILKHQFF